MGEGRVETEKQFSNAKDQVAVRKYRRMYKTVFAKNGFKANLKALKQEKKKTKNFADVQKIVRRLKKANPEGHGLPNFLGQVIERIVPVPAHYNGQLAPEEELNGSVKAAALIRYMLNNKMTIPTERAEALKATQGYGCLESNGVLVHDLERREAERERKANRPKQKKENGSRLTRVSAL
jgi:hypothetical protein